MAEVLVVGVGGFIGAALRYAISRVPFGLEFPVATLIANVIAGFFIGFFTELERSSGMLSPRTKLFLTTGMLGGLSTFSTFSMETMTLLSHQKYAHAGANVLLNLVLSFFGVALGTAVARLLCKPVSP